MSPFFPFEAILMAATYVGAYLARHMEPMTALIICVALYFTVSRTFATFCLLGVVLWRVSQLEKQLPVK